MLARVARAAPLRPRVVCSRLASSASAAVAPEAQEKASLVPTYSADGVRFKAGLVFTHGKGSTLYGDNGRAYVDWAAGIAVCALGHADEELQVSLRYSPACRSTLHARTHERSRA